MTRSLPARNLRLVRSPDRAYPLHMIEEGSTVLAALASLRFATAIQLQRAIFQHTASSPRQARSRATRSLRRLFDAGLVKRIPVFAPSAASGRMSPQVVNALSAAGARAIGLDPRWARRRAPKERQVLAHDFWLVEVAVLAMAGCPESLSITTWWDDRVLAARKRQGRLSLPVIPDGLLVVENLSTGKLFPCLVELDLGTEVVASPAPHRRDFARKIEGYRDYLGTPFRQEFGIQAPPIVLIITDGERRLASLRSVTRRLGGAGRYWFVTMGRLGAGPLPLDPAHQGASAARQGPFWAANWQTAHEDGWRSLATRCGVAGASHVEPREGSNGDDPV